MTRLPRVTASQTIKVITKIGFTLSRQHGSHKTYKNKEGKRVTVPYHGKKNITIQSAKKYFARCSNNHRNI